jgi:protein-S-isoprenylcysteine O-methyltransferase Ste14
LAWATPVAAQSRFSASGAAVILPFAFLRRIYREENVLKEEFGADYESYCSEVKMILPGVW